MGLIGVVVLLIGMAGPIIFLICVFLSLRDWFESGGFGGWRERQREAALQRAYQAYWRSQRSPHEVAEAEAKEKAAREWESWARRTNRGQHCPLSYDGNPGGCQGRCSCRPRS
jgi:hypothetical protein